MTVIKRGSYLILCEAGGPAGGWLYEQQNVVAQVGFDLLAVAAAFKDEEKQAPPSSAESQECRFAKWLKNKGYVQITEQEPALKLNLTAVLSGNPCTGGKVAAAPNPEHKELLEQYKMLVRALCKAHDARSVLPDYKAFTPFHKRAMIAAHINDDSVTTALLTGPNSA